jgi:hypothetical protein
MYQLKKLHEGIFLFNDDTGKSRMISPREYSIFTKTYPEFRKGNVVSWFCDDLPEGVKIV